MDGCERPKRIRDQAQRRAVHLEVGRTMGRERMTGWCTKRISAPLYLCVGVVSVAIVLWLGGLHVARGRFRQYRKMVRASALASPLPEAVVTPSANGVDAKLSHDYVLSHEYFTNHVGIWRDVLAPYAGQPEVQYLEVGAFEGGSLLWILENILTDPTAHATALDLFCDEYKDTYRHNIELSGLRAKVTDVAGYSQLTLRSLPLDHYDIIYIDGSHDKPDVLEDAVLSWRLLKEGGIMIFDDYRHLGQAGSGDGFVSPKLAIDAFVQCFEERCEVIHNGDQLIIRKCL